MTDDERQLRDNLDAIAVRTCRFIMHSPDAERQELNQIWQRDGVQAARKAKYKVDELTGEGDQWQE